MDAAISPDDTAKVLMMMMQQQIVQQQIAEETARRQDELMKFMAMVAERHAARPPFLPNPTCMVDFRHRVAQQVIRRMVKLHPQPKR